MDNIHATLERAQRQLSLADHLLTSTYPLSKDPKLLIGVLRNMHKAQDDVLLATIAYFAPNHTLSQRADFKSKLTSFTLAVADKGIVSKQELHILTQTHLLFEKHEQSTIEFARKSNMILADESYGLQVLQEPQLKELLSQSRLVIKKILLAVSY
ncbi:hypothetical protein K9M74_04940 [Candidatus Woesearchaeota archaeon]|nr:hypothetical protein [Candidatus Woesearchaeota archaeon]